MKGDFTRDTFDAAKHFSRVLLQQGRVTVDADPNEQASILLHYLRTLAADLIGDAGGPQDTLGFQMSFDTSTLSDEDSAALTAAKLLPLQQGDFLVGAGRYYVDGLLCENEHACTYLGQADCPVSADQQLKPGGGPWLVYLDVWERHLTWVQDASVREVALGGPDTCSRSKVLWQVKVLAWGKLGGDSRVTAPTDSKKKAAAPAAAAAPAFNAEDMRAAVMAQSGGQPGSVHMPTPVDGGIVVVQTPAQQQPTANFDINAIPITLSRALLRVRTQAEPADQDPCSVPPQNRYRGPENQLYRVELHQGGFIGDKPTFKWSRENGSVVFPVLQLDSDADSTTVQLASLGPDAKLGLAAGDWVELVDDTVELQLQANPLMQVQSVQPETATVVLAGTRTPVSADQAAAGHLLLRRWDQRAGVDANGTLAVVEGTGEDDTQWISLEDGIQIQFVAPAKDLNGNPGPANRYRTADYWLIPARVATGDVEWPKAADGTAAAKNADGVLHHYAYMAMITMPPTGVGNAADHRRSFAALAQ